MFGNNKNNNFYYTEEEFKRDIFDDNFFKIHRYNAIGSINDIWKNNIILYLASNLIYITEHRIIKVNIGYLIDEILNLGGIEDKSIMIIKEAVQNYNIYIVEEFQKDLEERERELEKRELEKRDLRKREEREREERDLEEFQEEEIKDLK